MYSTCQYCGDALNVNTAEILDLCDKRRELREKRFEPEGAAKYKEVNNNIKRSMKKA